LLCSHLLADVEDICDRIAILYGGRIQRKGLVKELLTQSDKTQILAEKLSQETLEKIKTVVEQADVDYEITTPMEKLEEFFIDIVHQAQSQRVPTSGAVAADVSEEASQVSDVLDKLIAPPVIRAEEIEEKQPATTVTVAQQDEQMLSDLIGSPETDLEPIETEKVQPETTEAEAGQVKKSVLDQLLGDDTNSKDSPQGDRSDA